MDAPEEVGGPWLDLCISSKQLLFSLWLFFRSLIATGTAVLELIFSVFKRGSYYFCRLRWVSQVYCVVGGLVAVFCVALVRSGRLQRIRRRCSRRIRQARSRMERAVAAFKADCLRIWTLASEFMTVAAPAVTIALPLKLYAAPHIMRRILSVGTFCGPVYFSIRSLIAFYNVEGMSRTGELAAKAKAALRYSEEPQPRLIQKEDLHRRTTPGGIVNGASLFYDSPRRSQGDPATAWTSPRSKTVQAVTVWLDYWVIAAVFDIFVAVPLLLLSAFFGANRVSVKEVYFGRVDEINLWMTSSSGKISTPGAQLLYYYGENNGNSSPSRIGSWMSLTAHALCSGLTAFYDLGYVLLFLFAVGGKQQYLRRIRHTLVGMLDSTIFTLAGVRLLNGSRKDRHHQRQQQQTAGVIPAAWAALTTVIPKKVVWFVNMLVHVPQLILLMFPSFLLLPAIFCCRIVYPVLSSMKSLEDPGVFYAQQRGGGGTVAGFLGARSLLQTTKERFSEHLSERSSSGAARIDPIATSARGYWLTYFTANLALEVFLLRWLRASPVWQLFFFHKHVELLMVTGLQIACLSPEWLMEFFVGRVQAAIANNRLLIEQTAASRGPAEVPASGEVQTSGEINLAAATRIKKEPIDEEPEPSSFRPAPRLSRSATPTLIRAERAGGSSQRAAPPTKKRPRVSAASVVRDTERIAIQNSTDKATSHPQSGEGRTGSESRGSFLVQYEDRPRQSPSRSTATSTNSQPLTDEDLLLRQKRPPYRGQPKRLSEKKRPQG